ncbi:MAG: hypothetical protein IKJ99_04790 [Oscillospiraceae bacterium]|nr:hypothetical protein [Oscillospiraceae bacterium]
MPDIVTIRQAAARAKSDGLAISEYAIRQWVRLGVVPVRKAGSKSLLSYTNLVSFLRCENGQDNMPPATLHRVEL